jgi:DNA-binding response OmpR family regulator
MKNISDLSFLVIDDDQHMLSIVRLLLQAFGADAVHECAEASRAVETFRAIRPDIIVVSQSIGPMSGIEFAKAARRSKESPDRYVPIILITSNSKRKNLYEARDAGITEILLKPMSGEDLLARIESIIRNPRPFIDAAGYVGPCRRQMQMPSFRGPERRKKSANLVVAQLSEHMAG